MLTAGADSVFDPVARFPISVTVSHTGLHQLGSCGAASTPPASGRCRRLITHVGHRRRRAVRDQLHLGHRNGRTVDVVLRPDRPGVRADPGSVVPTRSPSARGAVRRPAGGHRVRVRARRARRPHSLDVTGEDSRRRGWRRRCNATYGLGDITVGGCHDPAVAGADLGTEPEDIVADVADGPRDSSLVVAGVGAPPDRVAGGHSGTCSPRRASPLPRRQAGFPQPAGRW